MLQTESSPSLTELEEARRGLQAALERWENYDGNNPDKYRTQIAEARVLVHEIETKLKAAGVLGLSEDEKLFKELDKLFPNVMSKEVVEHQGRRFRRRFTPVATSLSGKTAKAWRASWEEVGA